MNLDKSQAAFDRSSRLSPGGVHSYERSFKQAGSTPPHLVSARGARARDLDGNELVDLVMAHGAMIVGHANEEVSAVLRDAVDRSTAFSAPTLGEIELCELIVERIQAIEMVRLVDSAGEALMSALHLSRAATGRDKVLLFEGADHGTADNFLVHSGSGPKIIGEPLSAGVPLPLAELALALPYNNLVKAKAAFEEHGPRLACVVVEPVAAHMGCVLPEPGFLEGLRSLCDEHGVLLVFDEVSTAFRVARGGYMQLTSVKPDLVTLGKVIGGGLPLGALGGRRDLLKQLEPSGKVISAGLSGGNPLAVSAGKKTLEILGRPGIYEKLEARGADLARGLETIAREKGVPASICRQGSMLSFFFRDKPPRNLSEANKTEKKRWKEFFLNMLAHGVLLPPSPLEPWYLSTAHGERAISQVLEAVRASL